MHRPTKLLHRYPKARFTRRLTPTKIRPRVVHTYVWTTRRENSTVHTVCTNLVATSFVCTRLAESRQVVHGRCPGCCQRRRIYFRFSISPVISNAVEMREVAFSIPPRITPARPSAHAPPPSADGNRVALPWYSFRRFVCLNVCLEEKNLWLRGIPVASKLAVA